MQLVSRNLGVFCAGLQRPGHDIVAKAFLGKDRDRLGARAGVHRPAALPQMEICTRRITGRFHMNNLKFLVEEAVKAPCEKLLRDQVTSRPGRVAKSGMEIECDPIWRK